MGWASSKRKHVTLSQSCDDNPASTRNAPDDKTHVQDSILDHVWEESVSKQDATTNDTWRQALDVLMVRYRKAYQGMEHAWERRFWPWRPTSLRRLLLVPLDVILPEELIVKRVNLAKAPTWKYNCRDGWTEVESVWRQDVPRGRGLPLAL